MASSPGSSQSSWGWSPETTTVDVPSHYFRLGNSPHSPYSVACMVLRNPPETRFRYRYDTEMSGTHGSLQAEANPRGKGVPTIELVGYSGPAVICVSLATCNDVGMRYPHPHHLFVKEKLYQKRYINLDEKKVYKTGHYIDPHYIVLREDRTAKFEGMCIINSKKEQFALVIREKLLGRGMRNSEELERMVEQALRNVDIAFVCLCFEAFRFEGGVIGESICPPLYSKPIANAKNASTGKLKITKINKCSGSCRGGDSIWLLVEKINKKGLVVRFFEIGPDGSEVWSADVEGDKLELHHQYAVIFNTPPYRDQNITRDVTVSMRLERRTVPLDCSDSETFVYEPSRYPRNDNIYRKESIFTTATTNKRHMSDLIQPYNLPSKRKPEESLFDVNQYSDEDCDVEIELLIKKMQDDSDANGLGEDWLRTLPMPEGTLEMDGPQESSKRTVALLRLILQLLATRTQLKDKDLRNVTERISKIFLKADEYRLQDAATTLLSLRSSAMKKPIQDASLKVKDETRISDIAEKDDNEKEEASSLFSAISNNDMERLEYLLREHQKDEWINARDKEGMTALHFAVSTNNTPAMKKLLAAGADANLKAPSTGRTARQMAKATGDMNILAVFPSDQGLELDMDDKSAVSIKSYSKHCPVIVKKEPPADYLVEIADLLNVSGKWKNLADLMGFSSVIPLAEKSENQSTYFFNYVEEKQGLDQDMLRNLLDALDEMKCVSIIDRELAKKYMYLK